MRDDSNRYLASKCKGIEFSSYLDDARRIAELYCQIWKEPPWCENFWKPEEVMRTLSEEMQRPDAECFLARKSSWFDIIVGFTWGYSVNRQELAKIAGGEQLNFIIEEGSRIFYIDELGVEQKHRAKTVGERLTVKLLDHAKERGLLRAVLRTDLRAIPARKLYAHLGFSELNIQDGRHENRNYWLLDL